uniref:ABC transporter domain-containing protein n=1 Tax=Stomoxys calcitrans TaxID=35570 RepID=A0A1I8PLE1_STOCA
MEECAEKQHILKNGDYSTFQRIPKEATINIHFNDLTYAISSKVQIPILFPAKDTKVIVNGVSGIFKAGELSAIIGPSGCGKTTLLNLLSGYRLQKTSGQIYVNNQPRQMKSFRKLSRYVLQEDHISPYFTVMETMTFASKLKLDSQRTDKQREAVVNEILDIFDLLQHSNTLISKLSGGQRKRICIALELIDNPSVLFLDEPTAGLDEVSASKCVRLLKHLADCGRTIICSLHCPSARLFQMFDKVYAMASGQCIYQGTVDDIVPYLECFSLCCPVSYNPTDFIIEVAMKAYGDYHNVMVEAISNGKVSKWTPNMEVATNECQFLQNTKNTHDIKRYLKSNPHKYNSWSKEYSLNLQRFLSQLWRDQANFRLRLAAHILSGLLIGSANINVSRNAKYSIYNYHFSLIVSIMFFFISMVPMLSTVPQDMQFIRRECFNQWYRLSSYFLALLTSQLPILCATSLIGTVTLYLGSAQPLELHRFLLFLGIAFATSMMASSFGLLLGSRFCVLHALFLGPYVMSGMIIMASYPGERTNLSALEYFVSYGNFVRYPLEGLLELLLGFGRPDFPCPETEFMCWSAKPKYILRLAGDVKISYFRSVLVLCGLYFVMSFMSFLVFKQRLGTTEKESNKSSNLGKLKRSLLTCTLRVFKYK